mmetsp:Transcript_63882/g.138875  ORF Transcript_63882/g.138875 Transcript_63882/m.138875 type:complete len:253 (+) Transcript_63882:292-1050(+)
MDLLELSSLTSASASASASGPMSLSASASALRSFASQSRPSSQQRSQSQSQPQSQKRSCHSLRSSTFDSELEAADTSWGGRGRWAQGVGKKSSKLPPPSPSKTPSDPRKGGCDRQGRGSLPESILSTSLSFAHSAVSSHRTKVSKPKLESPTGTSKSLRDLTLARRLFDDQELELTRSHSKSQVSTPSRPLRSLDKPRAKPADDTPETSARRTKPKPISRWAESRKDVTHKEADRIARIMRGSAERWGSDSD